MTNEHEAQAPDENKPVAADCDDVTIIFTRRESLRLTELMEDPPPRDAAFLRAQCR